MAIAAERPFRETHLDRIVAVGWGGRFGLINITHISGLGAPQIIAYGAEEDDAITHPPDLNGNFAVGDEIPRSLWTDEADPEGVLTIRTAAGQVGYLANFTRLRLREKTGAVIGDSVAPSTATFSANLKIYSGGVIKVDSLSGRYVHLANTGGTLHYDETRQFTTLPNSFIAWLSFDQNGYLGSPP